MQVAEGTLGYAAPEQMQYRNGSPKSDIYSLGATIIYFATGDNPYNDANDRNFILTQFTMGNPMDVSPSVEVLAFSLHCVLGFLLHSVEHQPDACALAYSCSLYAQHTVHLSTGIMRGFLFR